ncbi:hypothetical protein ACWCP6_03660 [Streptomyces sp. NPDC002004]
MNGTSVRRAGLAIAVAAALTGITACGGSGGGGKAAGDGAGERMSPVAALRSIASRTDRADSAKVEATTSLGTMMSMKADGTLGWGHGLTGDMTITYTGGRMADMMRQMGSSSMEARYLPEAYYAKMGDRFATQSGGKHWIKYEYDALASLTGGSGAYLKDQMQNSTPNQSVKLLLASGDVKKVGREKVRGVDTTHYSGTVDVAKLAERNSSLGASQLADLKKQLQQAGVTTEQVDIWVDAEDLLVKRHERGELSTGTMESTAYYSDYGAKVSAEEPSAGDTVDFKDLVKKRPTAGGTGVTS